MSKEIMAELKAIKGLFIQCPSCEESSPASRYKLFGMYDEYPDDVRKILKARLKDIEDAREELALRKEELEEAKIKKPEKISKSAQASNFGKISEQIIPAFKTFPYRQENCRIMLMPVDYVVFDNLHLDGKIDSIRFIDVKTGKAVLSEVQRNIRDRISDKKIKHTVTK